jgi:hypothetical protein
MDFKTEFKTELQLLAWSKNSTKLELVKNKLREVAENGETIAHLSGEIIYSDSAKYFCDENLIKWLELQGFEVKTVLDDRDGDYIRVSW